MNPEPLLGVAPRSGRSAHPAAPALRLREKAETIGSLDPSIEAATVPELADSQCLVEVKASGVNMSDVKAALGQMPHAVWPRTPGRDYAGVVVEGPVGLVGKEVWGSSGELGIRRDGAHARYVVVSSAEVSEKPSNITLEEAGAIGVPFITAYEGLQAAGGVSSGDLVLVLGGNGKVGQAVIQLATKNGARVFAVERAAEPYGGHSRRPPEMIDASAQDIAAHVLQRTGGHGADIVYNTVGSPYFEQACAAMANGARQIFISTLERAVPFDILRFFRGRHRFIGIDSLALGGAECAAILQALKPGFENGDLRPFPVRDEAIHSLEDAAEAYAAVWNGSRERVVLRPR